MATRKLLTPLGLFDPSADLGDAKSFLDTALASRRDRGRLTTEIRQEMIKGVNKLENSVYGRGKELTKQFAWRCFSCNTINGLQKGSYENIRKTCSKCAKPRKHEETVEQELMIDFLISEGWSYEAAKDKVLEALSVDEVIEEITDRGKVKL